MIKVVFMDVDDTIFDFSAFVKKTMKDGYENLKPEETIIIGDSITSDIAGGRNYERTEKINMA